MQCMAECEMHDGTSYIWKPSKKKREKKRKDGGNIRHLPIRMEEGQASPGKDEGRSEIPL